MAREIARERVEGRGGARRHPGDGVRHVVHQGLHRRDVTGMTHGPRPGNDAARRGLGAQAGRAATRGGAVALALAHGRHRGSVGSDDVAVAPRRALRQPARVGCDPLMGLERGRELGVQAPPRLRRPRRQARPALRHGPRPRQDVVSRRPQWGLGLAYPRHEDLAPPAARSAAAAPELREVVLEVQSWLRQLCPWCEARGRDGGAAREDLLGALYHVAASGTRGLPCALGQVSTTTCAGLTHPSSLAVAAWRAHTSSIHGPSRRRRTWASPAGRPHGSWEPSTGTVLIPQASITARSVRHRRPICASAPAHACVRSAHAHHTRVATGGRPRTVRFGNRGTHERSAATTRAAHGHVSAHGRRGGVSGTKSATWRHGPRPVSQCWRNRQSGIVGAPDRGRPRAAADDHPIPRAIPL